MWGLDTLDPRIAIRAMNDSVRNLVFAPIFFATPFVLAATGIALWVGKQKSAGLWFILAAINYSTGGLALTAFVNVPMNEALARITVPATIKDADIIWQAYSAEWQFWNQIRTLFSGIALALAAYGLLKINHRQYV